MNKTIHLEEKFPRCSILMSYLYLSYFSVERLQRQWIQQFPVLEKIIQEEGGFWFELDLGLEVFTLINLKWINFFFFKIKKILLLLNISWYLFLLCMMFIISRTNLDSNWKILSSTTSVNEVSLDFEWNHQWSPLFLTWCVQRKSSPKSFKPMFGIYSKWLGLVWIWIKDKRNKFITTYVDCFQSKNWNWNWKINFNSFSFQSYDFFSSKVLIFLDLFSRELLINT
jgi:hypothetical protein